MKCLLGAQAFRVVNEEFLQRSLAPAVLHNSRRSVHVRAHPVFGVRLILVDGDTGGGVHDLRHCAALPDLPPSIVLHAAFQAQHLSLFLPLRKPQKTLLKALYPKLPFHFSFPKDSRVWLFALGCTGERFKMHQIPEAKSEGT